MGLKDLKELGDTYSEDQVKQLAIDLGWKGTGTNNDPLIIDNSSELPQRIMILNSSMFINIVERQFVSMVVDTCQNITFDKCTFEILGVLRSSHINVSQGDISLLGLGRSSNNHFKECTIIKGFNLNNQSNIFSDCVFNKKSYKTFQKDFNKLGSLMNLSKIVKQFPYFIVAYTIIILCYFLFYEFNSIPLDIYWIFLFGAIFGLIALYFLLRETQRRNITKNKKVVVK